MKFTPNENKIKLFLSPGKVFIFPSQDKTHFLLTRYFFRISLQWTAKILSGTEPSRGICSYFLNQKITHLDKATSGRKQMKPTKGQSHTCGRTESKTQFTGETKLNGGENFSSQICTADTQGQSLFLLASYTASSSGHRVTVLLQGWNAQSQCNNIVQKYSGVLL